MESREHHSASWFSRVRVRALAVVGGLVLGGRDVADLAVEAPVVEPVDPLEDRLLEMVEVAPGAVAAMQLGLEQADRRLGEGIDARIGQDMAGTAFGRG